jgi:hypothetical protein
MSSSTNTVEVEEEEKEKEEEEERAWTARGWLCGRAWNRANVCPYDKGLLC